MAVALPPEFAWRPARPGLITTIGVLCIVIACLSGLSSFSTAVYGTMFYFVSSLSGRVAASSSGIASATSQPAAGTGLSVGDAGTAGNTLHTLLHLDSRRQRELTNLLHLHGGEIFPSDGSGALTDADVRAAVTKTVPTTDPASDAAAEFSTAAGSVSVFPDQATFASADGGVTIQTSAARGTDSRSEHSSGSFAVTAGAQTNSTTLTSADVDRTIAAANRLIAPSSLNPAQANTLRSCLSQANQQWVTPGTASPVAFVSDNGSTVNIRFDTGGWLLLDAQGKVIGSGSAMSFASGPPFHVSGGAALTVVIESVLSIVLAIYLLIVGILVLRPPGRQGTLLRVYALIKIPVALAAGLGIAWMATDFLTGITAAAASGPTGATSAPSSGPALGIAVGWGIGIALAGLAWPVALLILLRMRTAREYFQPPILSDTK